MTYVYKPLTATQGIGKAPETPMVCHAERHLYHYKPSACARSIHLMWKVRYLPEARMQENAESLTKSRFFASTPGFHNSKKRYGCQLMISLVWQ